MPSEPFTLKSRARIRPTTLAGWRDSRARLVTQIAVEILGPLIRLLAGRVTDNRRGPPDA